MPRIRRERIPEALMAHLVRRVREREISTAQLGLLARWLDADPEVPEGEWFKRFPEMIVCGEGSLVRHSCGPGRLRLARKFYNFVFGWQTKSASLISKTSSSAPPATSNIGFDSWRSGALFVCHYIA